MSQPTTCLKVPVKMFGLKKKANTNRPADTDFTQQRLKTRPVGITSAHIAIAMIILAILFIPSGTKLSASHKKVYEKKIKYDDDVDTSCSVSTADEGRQCQLIFDIDEDVDGPVYLYYEMTNYFQNHRRYYQSRSIYQLQGENMGTSDVELDCNPLYKNGSLLLNPCGLIANSFFTDIFVLDSDASVPANLALEETGISVKSDREDIFKQVDGFAYVAVADTSVSCASVGLSTGCKAYTDAKTGQGYLFYYPNDDTVQYLYESYPAQISPIDGVTDEHFIVWMKTSSLPTFRKLYGRIEGDLHAGDRLVFNVTANFEVDSFDATKTLLISNLGAMGGRNTFLGVAFTTIGSLCMVFGVVLLARAYQAQLIEYFHPSK